MAREHGHDACLIRRELHFLSGNTRYARMHVHRQLADSKLFVARSVDAIWRARKAHPTRAAQKRTNAKPQLVAAERLHQIVISAYGISDAFVDHVAFRRKEQHRYRLVLLANTLAHLKTVEHGHHHVKDNHVGPAPREMLERIAEESEEDIRVRVKRLLAFLEPGIILVLAGVVLLVVLSIFLAIMDMNVIK